MICSLPLFAEVLHTIEGKKMTITIIDYSKELLNFKLEGKQTVYSLPFEKIEKIVDANGELIDLSSLLQQEEPLVDYNGVIQTAKDQKYHLTMKGCSVYKNGKKVSYDQLSYLLEEHCEEASRSLNGFRKSGEIYKEYIKYTKYGLGISVLAGAMYYSVQDISANGDDFFTEPALTVLSIVGGATAICGIVSSVCAYHRYYVIKNAVHTYNEKCYQPEIALDAFLAPGQVGIALNF